MAVGFGLRPASLSSAFLTRTINRVDAFSRRVASRSTSANPPYVQSSLRRTSCPRRRTLARRSGRVSRYAWRPRAARRRLHDARRARRLAAHRPAIPRSPWARSGAPPRMRPWHNVSECRRTPRRSRCSPRRCGTDLTVASHSVGAGFPPNRARSRVQPLRAPGSHLVRQQRVPIVPASTACPRKPPTGCRPVPAHPPRSVSTPLPAPARRLATPPCIHVRYGLSGFLVLRGAELAVGTDPVVRFA